MRHWIKAASKIVGYMLYAVPSMIKLGVGRMFDLQFLSTLSWSYQKNEP